MQGVSAPSGSLAVQSRRLTLMASTLCLRNLVLDVAVEVSRLESIFIVRRRGLPQPQIDPYHLVRGEGLFDRMRHRHTQPPVAHAVLGKAAALEGFSL
jgi:hypothetical protein